MTRRGRTTGDGSAADAGPVTDAGAATNDGPAMTAAGSMTPARWLDEVPVRRIVEAGVETRVALPPGDRPLVDPGATILPGDALLEHLRDRRIDQVDVKAAGADRPLAGSRWSPIPGRRRRVRGTEGELLAPLPGKGSRWRLVTGEHRVGVSAVVGGTVVEVRPGAEIRMRVDGLALRGAFAAGAAARGRLELATDPFGDLRPGGIDVGRAGSILVVGSRIDAEALTRARAMGVHGIVVASLPGKELRDFQASERRQRAALHQPEPFAVLVLDGAVRRPIATPVTTLLEHLAGREVAILIDPPALVFAAEASELPAVPADWVRVRSGPNAGAEGRLLGLAGLRRFAAGVHLEAASVAFDGEPAVDIPIGDLERLA